MAVESCSVSIVMKFARPGGLVLRNVWRCICRLRPLALGLACFAGATVGSASAERPVFYYNGRSVTVRDLSLVKRSAAVLTLSRIAAGLSRPPSGVWPRERTAIGPAAPGYYQPRRGSSRMQVATHIWRMCAEGAALSYLSLRVQGDFLKEHPCNLAKYYHTGRVGAHLLLSARLLQRESNIFARCAGRRWKAAELAASLKRDFPDAGFSPSKWAGEAIPYLRSEPAWYLVGAYCFPLYRGNRVAVYWKSRAKAQFLMPAMLDAIRAQRPRSPLWAPTGFATPGCGGGRARGGARRAAGAAARAFVDQNAADEDRHFRRMRRTLAAIGSPTEFDRGFGGNSGYFAFLTGLPGGDAPTGAIVACKQWAHHYIYISSSKPVIAPAPAFLRARPPSFLWDAGVNAILTPICERVLAKCKPASSWFKKPGLGELLNASTPSVGLPAIRLFGESLPQLVRKPYRTLKWQSSVH